MSNSKYENIGSPITKVIEECGELIQILCKVDRFGWFNCHPDNPNKYNIEYVKEEMEDVVEACEKLQIEMRKMEYPNKE